MLSSATPVRTVGGLRTLVGSIALLCIISIASGQESVAIVGDWSGVLQAGSQSLHTVVHITSDAGGQLKVAMDSLDQGAMGLSGSNVVLKGSSFSFDLPIVHGSYTGTLSADGKTIAGTWQQGVPLPLVFTREAVQTPAPAVPPVALSDLKPVLDRELAPILARGILRESAGGGLVIGVLENGQRRVFAYGIAHPDSIFEIGSITKTFTGLALAQMVVQKKVTLDEPVRSLLPDDFVPQPNGPEITLLDLATQHAGLPRMPDNFAPANPLHPYVDYDSKLLREFLTKHGVAKPADAKFLYSNLGFGILGYALSLRAGFSYEQLVSTEITGPLHMSDTVVTLSPAQRKRLIQGYDVRFDQADPWEFDVFAGAGALRSTAADLLTYLDANLHPDQFATAVADSPAATLPSAFVVDHQLRTDAGPLGKIALAWIFDSDHVFWHNGGTGGYNSHVEFSPESNRAIVVLYNRMAVAPPYFADRVAEHIRELMSGKPSIPLDFMYESERNDLALHSFDNDAIKGSYHCRLTAFPLPAAMNDPFNAAATGDIHTVANGKGTLTEGTWEHRIVTPNLNLTCKLTLASGTYSVKSNGTGIENTKWTVLTPQSPGACVQFFSPAAAAKSTNPQLLIPDPSGRIFYTTSVSPFAVLSSVCEREAPR